MNLICALFGHQPEPGYGNHEGEGYLEVSKNIGRDGVGTEHASLFATCRRCTRKFKVGNIHIPRYYTEAVRKVREWELNRGPG